MKQKLFLPWKNIFSSLFVGILFSFSAYGQNIVVNGKITDSQTGEAIIGASVFVKGTGSGTITDLDGNFSLSAPPESTISVSFLGYKSKEFKAIPGITNITLDEDVLMLNEVIAIGYATGSQKTISGAVQKVNRADMNVGVVNTPLQAIKGKMAGVNITKKGGDPTASMDIRVRGTTSLSGGNDPLIIIDGIFADVGMLNALAPADIESFTVLKDASETAQYGSRGASGVIVVTTIKGKQGGAGKILTYEGTFGIETVYKNLKMLDGNQFRYWAEQKGLTPVDKGYSTNYFEEMERTGFTQNHNVSFGGSTTDYSNYRASIGVIDQQGIIKGNDMRNYTVKLDASQMMFNNKLKIEAGTFGSRKENNYLNDYNKTFYSAASFNPTYPNVPDKDGNWPDNPEASEIDNPLGRLDIQDEEVYTYMNAYGRLTWTIIEGLDLAAFGSYTYGDKVNSKYFPRTINAGRSDDGRAEKSQNENQSILGNLILNYKKTINNVHSIDALGLIEGQTYKYRGFNATSRRFGTDYYGFNNLKAGAQVKWGDVGGFANENSLLSYMARLNYIYDSRYIATINLRMDGSSKLGENDKWGFFPSGSLAWSITDEDFMKDYAIISNLKLRAGYGKTGNQDAISAYNSMALYTPDKIGEDPEGRPVTLPAYARNSNPELRWEVKEMFDAGIDLGLWNNKVTLTVDWYTSRTKDLLYNYPVNVPPFVFNTLLANLGEMKNDGLEITAGYTPIKQKDMELGFNVNFAYQTNELLSLDGTYNGQEMYSRNYEGLASFSNAGAIGGNSKITYKMVGHPLGVFYIPKSDGIIDMEGNGQYSYHLVNLDGVPGIDTGDGKDRYFAGQAIPKYYLGGNVNFRYKQWDAQVQFNGAFGHKIFNGTSLAYMNMTQFPNYNVLEDAPTKNIYDQTISDYWLEKGDYVNIDYLSIGYKFNVSKINWVKTLTLRASVNNLYTFTNYSGLSPMINSSVVNDNLGVDNKNFYPLSRTYSISLNVNF